MMSKLAKIDLSWDKTGHIKTYYTNLGNLDEKAQKEVIAFSIPALLIQQLCVQVRLYGMKTVKGVFQAILGNYSVLPINESMKNAHMIVHKKDQAIFVTFHPKVKFFSRGAEEGASVLVANYAKQLLNEGVAPHNDLVKSVLLFITTTYFEETMKPENYFSPAGADHKLSDGVKQYCRSLTYELFSLWRSDQFNNISLEKHNQIVEDYRGRLTR
jgi:hypothetical protein